MSTTRRVVLLITFVCAAWSMAYILIGGTVRGKAWFGNVSKTFFDDYKGGVPLLTLVLPVLVSTSTCALFLLAPPLMPAFFAVARPMTRRKVSGDVGFNIISFFFVLVPYVCYLLAVMHRHLQGSNMTTDDKMMEIGNSFGMMATISLSFFLIPVARHSPLLTLMGWSPANAICIHIWSARICIFGVAAHGVFHMVRWWMKNENVFSMLLPPMECWKKESDDFEPSCVSEETDCSCYDHFRNMTGFLALVALIIIGSSSLNSVRRKHYNLFYVFHVISGPCALLMAVLHWNRMILYLAPSLLYYFGCSVPVLVESLRRYTKDSGIKILSVADIPSDANERVRNGRPCLSMTFEVSNEARRQYSSGMYVKISVPGISMVAHPFTVNAVPRDPNQMRIIFRVIGPFTSALARHLLHPAETVSSSDIPPLAPIILMDGFHGSQTRLHDALRHDSLLFIAGGIGITPYLTLLRELCSILKRRDGCARLDQNYKGEEEVVNEICLHWVCRDKSLIDYISEEYFNGLVENGAFCLTSSRIRIIIHDTRAAASGITFDASDDASTTRSAVTVPVSSIGVPMHPSRFSAGTRRNIRSNIPYFLTFASISWLGLWSIWVIYTNFQSKDKVASRSQGIVALLVISLIVAYFANIVADALDEDTSGSSLRRYTGSWWSSVEREEADGAYSKSSSQHYVVDMEREFSLPNLSSDSREEKCSSPFDDEMAESPCPEKGVQDISLEGSIGRPSSSSILRYLDGASCPGIFMCGPEAMMTDMQRAARAKFGSRVAIYKEKFEL